MKKRDKKLQLNRETVRRLDPQRNEADNLAHAIGGAAVAFGPQTSCVQPNCCGDTTLATE